MSLETETPDIPRAEGVPAKSWQRIMAGLVAPWLLAFVVGFPVLWIEVGKAIQGPLRQDRADTLQETDEIIRRTLDSLRRDTTFLTTLFSQLPREDLREGSVPATLFVSFAASARFYDQLRWIDEEGKERLRVNMRGGPPSIAPVSSLQNKRDRPYFKDTVDLPPGSVTFSSIDLNEENGHVEVPHEPVIRVASPLIEDGARHGVLVINYRATRLLDRLSALGNMQGLEVYLADQAGNWVMGPTPEHNWAARLGVPNASLSDLRPGLWKAMQASEAGEYHDDDGEWAFRIFTPTFESSLTDIKARVVSDPMKLRLVVRIPEARLAAQNWRWQAALAIMMSSALVVVLVHGYRTARSLRAEQQRTDELDVANRALVSTNRHLRVVQSNLARSERLSSLGLMVAGVAHELNTPLGSATLAISTVRMRFDQLKQRIVAGLRKSDLERFVGESDDGLDLAQKALRRTSKIVQRFKQVAVDRTTMDRRTFNLSEIILESDRRLRRWDVTSPIELSLALDESIVMDSYPGPLEQVIANLLDNALKHAFSAGDRGTIRLSCYLDGPDDVVIEFGDDGVGVPKEFLTKIFDPFYTTSRHAGGTGLGLHIAHQLVSEVLGGTIVATNLFQASNQSHGTLFTLRLPRSPAATVPTPS